MIGRSLEEISGLISRAFAIALPDEHLFLVCERVKDSKGERLSGVEETLRLHCLFQAGRLATDARRSIRVSVLVIMRSVVRRRLHRCLAPAKGARLN
jgi:hypothetical protein